jgi:hypothetical protein
VSRLFFRSGVRAQRRNLPQHAQAVLKEANLASFLMIPPHRYLAQAQTRVMREIKQLNIEGESIEMSSR